MAATMEFHSSLAESDDLEEACDAVASEVRRRLGGGGVELLVAFASAAYGDALDRLPVMLQERVGAGALIGCTGASQMTAQARSDGTPALAVLAGRLPGVELAAAAVGDADLPHADAPPSAWRALLPAPAEPLPAGAARPPVRGVVALADPFDCDVRALLAGLDFVLPGIPKVGGLCSGSSHPEGNALFCGRRRLNHGAVLLTLAGDVTVEPVVSQGCRPIGRPGRITAADRNRLSRIDDQPVRRFVREQLQTLASEELELAEGSPLFLGIASDPFATTEPAAGDFLVRNVLGVDGDGSLVVGERLAVGRSVQLHLRDATSGRDDLEQRLRRARADRADAALMFRCVGRAGEDHELFASVAPDVPLAACTCNGELGPVGGVSHVHGYTASCLLLREGRSA